MYEKIVVTKKIVDREGNLLSVALAFFDSRGIIQLELQQISGRLFPSDIKIGKPIVFNSPARISEIKK